MICAFRNFTLFIFVTLLTGQLVAQTLEENLDYGLSFASHEVTKDQRTSLELTPHEPFDILADQDVEISFDFGLKRLTNAYGYVLRIIANDSINIDLVTSPENDDFNDLNLIINNKPTNIHYNFQDVNLSASQWTQISLDFNAKNNLITLRWQNLQKSQNFEVGDLKSLRLFFGANNFGKYNTADVPPMTLRNVVVKGASTAPIQWELKRHGQDLVRDQTGDHTAAVKNPTWLIDKHIKWVFRQSFSINKYPSIAFDKNTSEIYAADERAVYIVGLNGNVEKKTVTAGNLASTDANQLLYINETRQLINYDLTTNVFSRFDFEKSSWENKLNAYNEPNYWHNNKFFNPIDKSVYTFGGYGHFAYKNKFSKYDAEQQKWVEVRTDGTVPPRYLSALGMTGNDKVLIFGGYGSESGKQELFPQSFYDLYSLDLKTHEVKKLQDYKDLHADEDIVFSNSLVVNDKDSCLYVLSFPKNKFENHIKLRRYNLDRVESTILADSIPFRFHDEHSFCDLFLSEATKELIAITSHKENDHFKISVYSIQYPPLSAGDVLQNTEPDGVTSATYWISAFVVLAAISGGVFFLKKKKAIAGASRQQQFSHQNNGVDVIKTLPEGQKPISTIYVFGGFQVFDKNGVDITSKFTMTLKELFVMILLHSIKFEKGISTQVLQEHLWPDKDEVSARNNRNVNIKKLRSLLEEIGNITIENNNAYLRLIISDEVFCDYQGVQKILSNTSAMSPQLLETLLQFVKRGNLLPNLQAGWLDSFKSDISNKVIDVLLEFSQTLDINRDDKTLLEIADAIFNYDSINQEALVIKCSVLNKKGKYSLAKTWYDHFVKEYNLLYAESYPKSFEEVIS